MQKLIPVIYFYLLSVIGMGLFIIGLFNAIHFVVGISVYEKYPLRYGDETRCSYMYQPMPVEGQKGDTRSEKEVKDECLQSLDRERQNTKVDDLEKSFAFTIIGLLVFGTHFYFARKQTAKS